MTSTLNNYPTRIAITFKGKKGEIVLDQIHTVDKNWLIKNLGSISTAAEEKVLSVL